MSHTAGIRALVFLISFSSVLSATLAPAQTQGGSPAAAPADVPSSQPQALSTTVPARLADVEGSVRIEQLPAPASTSETPDTSRPAAPGLAPPPPPDTIFKQAVVNMPVMAGMQVDTGEDGRAELQFNDGSIARLTPGSAVQVVSLEGGAEQLRAVSGLSYYELPERGGGNLVLQAGPYRVQLEQGALVRLDLDATPYQAAVVHGSAHFSNQASGVGFEAVAGETATLDPVSPTAYDLKQDVASDSWDQWNDDRDTALAEMASGETNARVGNGNGDESAWNDLDYYGTWYNVPGVGMAWSPDGVDTSFDPYGQGAWGYYPGSGYVWASAYPWGWLPYRCGGWSFYNQFGWMWQPGGGCGYGGSGWYPYGGIHRAPGGYRLPLRPFDPRLRTRLGGVPLPRSHALTEVHRGQAFQFRQNGDARPEPRAFPVENALAFGGATAPTLPVVAVPPAGQYRSGNAFNGGAGRGVSSEHISNGRAIFSPGARAFTPPPRALPAPRIPVSQPPRFSPPPAAAPHMAAPAPAAHGH